MTASPGRRCNKLVALTGLSLLVGCSSYESKWTSAAAQPTEANGIEGRWEGTWQSDANHHSGGLRCILTRTGPDTYHADYHATYWKIFSFGYETDLSAARREGETVYFNGAADLGWLAGGEYQYDGHATPTEYLCNYRSKGDHGTFRMTRPDQAFPVKPVPAAAATSRTTITSQTTAP
jgi:hypothetical protein